MTDVTEYIFESKSNKDTEIFAEKLGAQLRGGEIIELIGDIGAGKTTFVRGLARGAGSNSPVSSPTFTVSNVYDAPNLTIHHYDFYRLDDVAIIQTELQEVTADTGRVAVLEWAQAVQGAIQNNHVSIYFTVTVEEGRNMRCVIPSDLNYLKEKV